MSRSASDKPLHRRPRPDISNAVHVRLPLGFKHRKFARTSARFAFKRLKSLPRLARKIVGFAAEAPIWPALDIGTARFETASIEVSRKSVPFAMAVSARFK